MNQYHEIEPTQEPEGGPVQKVAGFVALLAFLAVIVLIIILLSTLLGSDIIGSPQPVPTQYLLVIVSFVFALGMFVYGKSAYGDTYEAIVHVVFGWSYVLLGAGLVGVVAKIFVTQPGFGFFDFLIYATAVALIASFGIIIAKIVNEPIKYFAIPFMLVALWQVVLWVWRVLSESGIAYGWNLAGSLFLFLYTVFFIVLMLRDSTSEEGIGED